MPQARRRRWTPSRRRAATAVYSFDVGNREQCREVLEQDIEAHGAWYGVVSNAGITRDGAFPALSEDDWDSVIHTNLDSFITSFTPALCR